MRIVKATALAFSLFSILPVPQVEWKEENLRYALCAFPLIGAVIGLACWLWYRLGLLLALPQVLMGAGWCLIPLALSGGIHMDGFCDTCDALASHAAPERKREIMKDPCLGAFGAIRLGMLLMGSFALWVSLPAYRPIPVLLGFCLSRALSSLALLRFPLAAGSGLADTLVRAADRGRASGLLILVAALLSAGLCCCGWAGAGMALCAWGVFASYRRMALREFGGVSGDLAGWFLQTAELWMLAALCLIPYLEARL